MTADATSNTRRWATFRDISLWTAGIISAVAAVVGLIVQLGGDSVADGPVQDVSTSTTVTVSTIAQATTTVSAVDNAAASTSSSSPAAPAGGQPTSASTTVLKKAAVTSTAFTGTHEAGTSVALTGAFQTKHDSRASAVVSASPADVCSVTKSAVEFVGAGKCSVTVRIPKSGKFLAATTTFSVSVVDAGLSAAQLNALSGFWKNDSSVTNLHRSYGAQMNGDLALARPVKDFKKQWRMKMSVRMPRFNGKPVNCRKIYVRYSYNGVFGFNGAPNDTTKSCASFAETFDACVQFNPTQSHRATGGAYSFPADENQVVKFDFLDWGIDWLSDPLDHEKAKLLPPEVTVTDVRPGSC